VEAVVSSVLEPHAFDPEDLARTVDERVLDLPPGFDPARLFGVRSGERGIVLVPFWSGVARDIPAWVCPPPGCLAIALETGGWAAPLDPDGSMSVPPSRHPQRRRVHHTVLVHGEGDDVSVLRDGQERTVLRNGVGVVAELVRECWERRPEATIRSPE
jgi:hypothetical protein